MQQTEAMAGWAMSLRRPGETQKDTARLSVEDLFARQQVKMRGRGQRRPGQGNIVNQADSKGQTSDPEIAAMIAESEGKREAKSLAAARRRIEPYTEQGGGKATMSKQKKTASARDRATVQAWEDKVKSTMIDKALLKSEAIRFLAVNEPGLHADYIAAYNAVARRNGDLRAARAAVRRERGGAR